MKTFLRFLRLDFIPASPDLAFLVLRIWLGLSLLWLHGWGKFLKLLKWEGNFSDPLGVGAHVSLTLAVLGEVVGPILIMLGFCTRLGALLALSTMAVAFIMVHDMALSGPRSGELAFIYLGGFVALFLAGPGRFSLDGKVGGSGKKAPVRKE